MRRRQGPRRRFVVAATKLRPSDSAPAPTEAQRVTLTAAEFGSLLAALNLAYDAAEHLADVGVLDFSPFEPLARALARLRKYRDGAAA